MADSWGCVDEERCEIGMKTIELTFEGYYIDNSFLPDESGIYCVYRCVYDPFTDKVGIKDILYIGESEHVKSRVVNHNKYSDWEDCLNHRERLCFSFAPVNKKDREHAEAALIYCQKPILNEQHVYEFGYPPIKIATNGRNKLLEKCFYIDEDENLDFLG